ncbi:hypothetical protein B0J14DRAFT_648489 [Halenospora varia]|nr:hypothetical protein B0J14DRAFT_648489 [Halenospora varia]
MLATPTWSAVNNGQNAPQQAGSFPPVNVLINYGQDMPQQGATLAPMSGSEQPGRIYDSARDMMVRRLSRHSHSTVAQVPSLVVAPIAPAPAQGGRKPLPDSRPQGATPAQGLFSTQRSLAPAPAPAPAPAQGATPAPAPRNTIPVQHDSYRIERRAPQALQAQRPVKKATGTKKSKKAQPATPAEPATSTQAALAAPAAPSAPEEPLPQPVLLGDRLTVDDTPYRTEESWATEFVPGQYYALGLQRNRLVSGDSPGCYSNPGWGTSGPQVLTKRPTTQYVLYIILSLVPGGRLTKQCLLKTACEWFPELRNNEEQSFRAALCRHEFYPYGREGRNTWRNLMFGEEKKEKAAGGAKPGNQNKKRGLDAANGNVEEGGAAVEAAPRPKRARRQKKASPNPKPEESTAGPSTEPASEPVPETSEQFVVAEPVKETHNDTEPQTQPTEGVEASLQVQMSTEQQAAQTVQTAQTALAMLDAQAAR